VFKIASIEQIPILCNFSRSRVYSYQTWMASPAENIAYRQTQGDVDLLPVVSCHPWCVCLALRFCSSHHDTEDLVQEVS
jgi:hypothetical protein